MLLLQIPGALLVIFFQGVVNKADPTTVRTQNVFWFSLFVMINDVVVVVAVGSVRVWLHRAGHSGGNVCSVLRSQSQWNCVYHRYRNRISSGREGFRRWSAELSAATKNFWGIHQRGCLGIQDAVARRVYIVCKCVCNLCLFDIPHFGNHQCDPLIRTFGVFKVKTKQKLM